MVGSALTDPPKVKVGRNVKRVPFTDAKGVRHWVEVEADAADALEAYDRWARRREAKFRANHVTATDAAAARVTRPARERYSRAKLVGFINHELEPASRAAGLGPGGYPWEGPRAAFTLLLGGSPTWDGPGSLAKRGTVASCLRTRRVVWVWSEGADGERCRFCGQYLGELPAYACCLACDRTGRDGSIEPGLPRRREKVEPSELKGGRG